MNPYVDSSAIPDGFVNENEDITAATESVSKENTGLIDLNLQQLNTDDKPSRDPRGQAVTLVLQFHKWY